MKRRTAKGRHSRRRRATRIKDRRFLDRHDWGHPYHLGPLEHAIVREMDGCFAAWEAGLGFVVDNTCRAAYERGRMAATGIA